MSQNCSCSCHNADLTPSQRLKELGLELPTVPAPVAQYIPATRVGNQVWTSGQLPFKDGALQAEGLVGQDVDCETASKCAETAVLNALAAVAQCVELDSIRRVLKITGFVASAPGFHQQPAVVNGASDLVARIFGDAGQHVRSAVGVAELPLGAPVEIELVVETGEL